MPRRNDTRDDTFTVCPICQRSFRRVGRRLYCTPSCRQQAFRFRHRQPNSVLLTDLTHALRRQKHLVGQTVYECPTCNERLPGQRRCDQCNLMCRKVGLGGRCSECDDIMTVAEFIGLELLGGATLI